MFFLETSSDTQWMNECELSADKTRFALHFAYRFWAFMIIGCWWWCRVMLMAVAVVEEIKWKADRKVYLFPSQHFITGGMDGRKAKKICFITKFIAEKSSIKWEYLIFLIYTHFKIMSKVFWCWFWMNDWWGMRRYFAGAFGMKKDEICIVQINAFDGFFLYRLPLVTGCH